jgi:hypothetical protein
MTTTSELEEHLQLNRAERHRRAKEDFAPRLRRNDASEYLFEIHGIIVAPNTLAKKAVEGGGPRFRRYGRIPYYDTQELDRYALETLGRLRSSTSDSGQVP